MDTAVLPYQQLFGCRQTGSGVSGRKNIENQHSGAIAQMEEYIRKYSMYLVIDYV